jgi:hypothetical protein
LFFTRRKKKKKKKKKTKVNGKRQSAKAHSIITTTTEYLSKRAQCRECNSTRCLLSRWWWCPRRIYIHIYTYILLRFLDWSGCAVDCRGGTKASAPAALCTHTTFSQGLELTSAFMPHDNCCAYIASLFMERKSFWFLGCYCTRVRTSI